MAEHTIVFTAPDCDLHYNSHHDVFLFEKNKVAICENHCLYKQFVPALLNYRHHHNPLFVIRSVNT